MCFHEAAVQEGSEICKVVFLFYFYGFHQKQDRKNGEYSADAYI